MKDNHILMKNKLLFLFTFFLIVQTVVRGQDEPVAEREPRFGFRIGANYSTIISDDFELIAAGTGTSTSGAEEYRIGATAGFFAEYPLTDLLSIQPEIQYSTQGNLNQELRLNYIQLPVLLKFNLSDVVNFHIGPQGGFKVWEWERNDVYSNFEFSALAGLGINITDNFFTDLRYSYGFTNIFDDAGEFGDQELKGVNSYFQLTLGYRM